MVEFPATPLNWDAFQYIATKLPCGHDMVELNDKDQWECGECGAIYEVTVTHL